MNIILTAVLVCSIFTIYYVNYYKEKLLDLKEQQSKDRIEHKKQLAEAWNYYNKNLIKLVNRIKHLEEKLK